MAQQGGTLKLYVFFTPAHFSRIAPLFVDTFPLHKGDAFISRNNRRCRVRFRLARSISREQIVHIENGRARGFVRYYMQVPPSYRLKKGQ